MTISGPLPAGYEWLKIPNDFVEGQEDLYTLNDLPQRGDISQIAIGTGWQDVDDIFKVYPGQFVVLTGLPGHGKSTLMFNLLLQMNKKHGTRMFLYVPENEAHLKAKLTRIWGQDPGLGMFMNHDCYVQSAVPSQYDAPPHTLPWVLEQAIVTIEKRSVDILMIDPWNEIEWAKPKDMTMTDYIGECLKLLKSFSRMYAVTVILIAHPTKAPINRGSGVTLGDIEGSMHWYNKCDNGLIVERDSEKQATKLISAKVREVGAGKVGVCWFAVDALSEQFFPMVNPL